MSGKNALMSVINQNARQQGQAGAFDALASIISGAAAEPVAGYAGIMAAPSGRGGDVVRGTQDALTYQPRTEQGQRILGQFGAAMAPVGEAFQQGAQYLGDTAYDATGSPVMAAAAYSAPTAIAEILGLKGAGKAARASGANQYEMGDISSYTQGPQGKQRGIVSTIEELNNQYSGEGIQRSEGPSHRFYSGSLDPSAGDIEAYGVNRADGNIFGGIFASPDRGVAGSHGENIREFNINERDHIDHDDMRHATMYDPETAPKARDLLKDIFKKHKHIELSNSEAETVMDYVMEDRDIFDPDPDDLEIENINDAVRGYTDERGDVSWDFQGIKGELARRLGYKSVGMPDEHGESALILSE